MNAQQDVKGGSVRTDHAPDLSAQGRSRERSAERDCRQSPSSRRVRARRISLSAEPLHVGPEASSENDFGESRRPYSPRW